MLSWKLCKRELGNIVQVTSGPMGIFERHSTSLGEALHDSTGHTSCSLAIFESLKGALPYTAVVLI